MKFKKGDKIKYLDQPGVITRVDNKMGRTFYSVKFKTKTGGIRAADSILSTDGSITEQSKGLWHNINQKKKSGKKSARKGSKVKNYVQRQLNILNLCYFKKLNIKVEK